MSDHPALEDARAYAAKLTSTVQAVLPGSREYAALHLDSKVTIAAFEETPSGPRIVGQPLYISDQPVGSWKLVMYVDLDWTRQYLKVTASNFSLSSIVDRTPLVRYEFDDTMRTAPIAHWQMHGERGAFSTLLAQAKSAGRDVKPHSLSSLHFPVGGARMRPGVDDLLEFMIRECGVDACVGWKAAIHSDREEWRTIQARTIARDMQDDVAAVLQDHGWTVVPPKGREPERAEKFTQRW